VGDDFSQRDAKITSMRCAPLSRVYDRAQDRAGFVAMPLYHGSSMSKMQRSREEDEGVEICLELFEEEDEN